MKQLKINRIFRKISFAGLVGICLGMQTDLMALQRRVLFLGNSFTANNNLPLIVKNIAQSAGDTFIYDSHLVGGYSLQEHSIDLFSLNKIQSDDWDYIVLQEQSQRPAFIVPAAFMDGFMALRDYIRANKPCAQILSYMTWGYKDGDPANCTINPGVCTYEGMQQLIKDRYMEISNLNDAEVAAAGVVWKYIKGNYPAIELYDTDGRHPSLAGSYLSACVIYTALFRKDPLSAGYNGGLAPATALIIRNAVSTIIYNQMDQWYIGRYIPEASFDYKIGTGTNEIEIYKHDPTYRDAFYWDFGDGTSSTDLRPSHSYAAIGTYTITLTASKCYMGDTISHAYSRQVTFCDHTPTIFPDDLILCPDEKDTIWTQAADSYQWLDFYGEPIPGETNRWMYAETGNYSVSVTQAGCTERSAEVVVDGYVGGVPPECEPTNGIDDPKLSLLEIVPNPVSDYLYLRNAGNIISLQLYDMNGRKWLLRSNRAHVYDLRHLPNGIYLLHISNAAGRVQTAKIVKQ